MSGTQIWPSQPSERSDGHVPSVNSSRVVIVGAGFAGYDAARSLTRALPPDSGVEIVLVNPVDYFLYLPLLPEVAAAILDPRRITVPIPDTLRGVRLVLGDVASVSLTERTVSYTDPEGGSRGVSYDRLVLAVGSVNKLLPIPGVAEHAHGFRGVAEALYLRDHVVRQFELADSTDDADERTARCALRCRGRGVHGHRGGGSRAALSPTRSGPAIPICGTRRCAGCCSTARRRCSPSWIRGCPARPTGCCGSAASRSSPRPRCRRPRGMACSSPPESSSRRAPSLGAWACRSRPAGRGERPRTQKGRLVVEPTLVVPGHPDVFACGDAAAVPDLTRPGQVTAMTAQHATRQGKLAGRNVAASLGYGRVRRYKHHDLGFVVDLGGTQAAANPLRIPLSGLPAKTVARGYHLLSMPGNRVRTAIDWILDAVTGRQVVQLGLVRSAAVPLDTAAPRPAQEGTRSS